MKISRLLFFGLSLLSGTAMANPIRIVGGLSVEATGNTHVRIRFYANYGNTTPDVATYGTSHSDWFVTGESYTADTGSGVKSSTYHYMCDCHVPTGSPLTYTAVGASSAISESALKATITPSPKATTLCDVECAEGDSRDGGVDTGPDVLLFSDVNPSQDVQADRPQDTPVSSDAPVTPEKVPDAALAIDTTGTVATGGSTATSSATSTGSSVAPGGSTAIVASSASTATGGNTGTTNVTTSESASKKSSGCSVSPRGERGVLSLALALGVVAVGWRRRR